MKLLNLFAIKNQENKFTSGGRSMVEMLGVLAIIGVLSVGAISGYNTAMYKHRMNKTIQTFSALLFNLIELSNKKGDFFINGRETILAYHLLSEEQCPPGTREYHGDILDDCKFPVGGGSAYISRDGRMTLYFHIGISFFEGDIVKSCVDFLSYGWQNMYPPEWIRADNNAHISQPTYQIAFWLSGDKKEITLSDVQKFCDKCNYNGACDIDFHVSLWDD